MFEAKLSRGQHQKITLTCKFNVKYRIWQFQGNINQQIKSSFIFESEVISILIHEVQLMANRRQSSWYIELISYFCSLVGEHVDRTKRPSTFNQGSSKTGKSHLISSLAEYRRRKKSVVTSEDDQVKGRNPTTLT